MIHLGEAKSGFCGLSWREGADGRRIREQRDILLSEVCSTQHYNKRLSFHFYCTEAASGTKATYFNLLL
jgi:hypothetical protein